MLKVFWPREYDVQGEKRTHYLEVGAMFPHERGEGYSLRLYFRVLPGTNLVAFPPRQEEGTAQRAPESDDHDPF